MMICHETGFRNVFGLLSCESEIDPCIDWLYVATHFEEEPSAIRTIAQKEDSSWVMAAAAPIPLKNKTSGRKTGQRTEESEFIRLA